MNLSDNHISADNVVNILDQYRAKPKPADAHTPDGASKRAYRAYGVDAPQKRPTLISIHYGGECKTLIQKSFLTRMEFTGHQHLAMIFSDCIITLEGRHLDQLELLFQDEKILSLHCFDAKIHDKPAEEEILITSIQQINPAEWRTKKEKTA